MLSFKLWVLRCMQRALWRDDGLRALALSVEPSLATLTSQDRKREELNKALCKLQADTVTGMIIACDYKAQYTHPVPKGKVTRGVHVEHSNRSGQVRTSSLK